MTEYRSKNVAAPPVYFYTPEYVPEKPASYKFSSGSNQSFPNRACIIDFDKFNLEDVSASKEDEYYPIVITIETDQPVRDFEMENNNIRDKRQAQITYGYFNKNSRNEFVFMFNKQCLLFQNKLFKVEDIYGHERHNENDSDVIDDSHKECVICYSTIKDTIVYP